MSIALAISGGAKVGGYSRLSGSSNLVPSVSPPLTPCSGETLVRRGYVSHDHVLYSVGVARCGMIEHLLID